MAFKNTLFAAGGNLAITSIQSPNFVTGVSGWQINKLGNAEFNNVIIRGLITVPSDYAARSQDFVTNPPFTTVGSFVEFQSFEWNSCVLKTQNNRATVFCNFEGWNKNTATSTLRVAFRIYSAPDVIGPWTLEYDFDIKDSGVATSGGVGINSFHQGAGISVVNDLMTHDLVNRPWIKVVPGWRISSGAAVDCNFNQGRLTVNPGV